MSSNSSSPHDRLPTDGIPHKPHPAPPPQIKINDIYQSPVSSPSNASTDPNQPPILTQQQKFAAFLQQVENIKMEESKILARQKQLLCESYQIESKQLDLLHQAQLYQLLEASTDRHKLQNDMQTKIREQNAAMDDSSTGSSVPAASSPTAITHTNTIEVKLKLQNFLVQKNLNATTIGSMTREHHFTIPQPPTSVSKNVLDSLLHKSVSAPNLLKLPRQGTSERKFVTRLSMVGRYKRIQQAVANRRRQPYWVPLAPNPSYEEDRSGCYNPARMIFPMSSMPNISVGRPYRPIQQQPTLITNSMNISNSQLMAPSTEQQQTPVYSKSNTTVQHPQTVNQPPVLTSNMSQSGFSELPITRFNTVQLNSQTLHNLVRTQSAPTLAGACAVQLFIQPKLVPSQSTMNHVPQSIHEGQEVIIMPEVIDLTEENSPSPRSITNGVYQLTTGIAYDEMMLKHVCVCSDNLKHPENSGRLQHVWDRLVETGLAGRCELLHSRKATEEELQIVHTKRHTMVYGANGTHSIDVDGSVLGLGPTLVRKACGGFGTDLHTIWNEKHTASAARMAVGCVVDLALKTMRGVVRNGFALVRPPGHNAEPHITMGFCFFNSVAIAAKLLQKRISHRVSRILIVDWDIHHGNGTQQVFYDDPNVLVISLHRYDDGHFWPGTGHPAMCGVGPGAGYNVNVSWSVGQQPPLGDAEYLAAFRTVVMPIAHDFNPDIVLVSAGFNAADGNTTRPGGFEVSPACFGYLTRELMKLTAGKVVMALEGGYDLRSLCDSAQECIKALLGDDPTRLEEVELRREPIQSAVETLRQTISIQIAHWPCLRRFADTIHMSFVQARDLKNKESDAVIAMAGLSMQSVVTRKSDVFVTSTSASAEPMEKDDTFLCRHFK